MNYTEDKANNKKDKKNYKKEIAACLNDLKSIKTFYKQIPNILTISRPLGTIPINILYFTGHHIGALIISLIVFLTDFFDGKIARKYNLSSEFGAKLDAVCDKIMFFGLSIPLAYNLPFIIPTLVAEGLISITNITKYKQGYDVKTNYAGKIKTWFLSSTLALGYLSIITNIPKIVISSAIISTLITEIVALYQYANNKNIKNDNSNIENSLINISNENLEMETKSYNKTKKNNYNQTTIPPINHQNIADETNNNVHEGKRRTLIPTKKK